MKETRKFDITINDHRFVGEEEYGGQIYISRVFIKGKEIGLWNKRIGYALSAKRLGVGRPKFKTTLNKIKIMDTLNTYLFIITYCTIFLSLGTICYILSNSI